MVWETLMTRTPVTSWFGISLMDSRQPPARLVPLWLVQRVWRRLQMSRFSGPVVAFSIAVAVEVWYRVLCNTAYSVSVDITCIYNLQCLFVNIECVGFCRRKRALILCGWSQDVDSATMPLIDRSMTPAFSSKMCILDKIFNKMFVCDCAKKQSR